MANQTDPSSLLRRLDYMPVWLAVVLGIGAGTLLAAVLLRWAPPLVGAVVFVVLLGGAVALASSGGPIAVVAPPSESEPVTIVAPPPEPERAELGLE
ncbi:MAG: hypothetical protein V3R80_12215, partial [Candidatus Tectomicrobia bacterium]